MILKIFFIVLISLSFGLETTNGQGVWTTDTSTGFISRRNFTSCVVNDKIYVFGGTNGGLPPPQIFDPLTHQWTTPQTSGDTIGSVGSTSSVINGKIYVTLDSVYVFDPTTKIWVTLLTSGNHAPRSNFASCVVGSKIYVIGGTNQSGYGGKGLNTFDVFDASTNIWSSPTTFGTFTGRSGMTANLVNGKIYVIGGDTNISSRCNLVEVFDPSTNTWSTPNVSGLFIPRSYHTASVLNNKIYVIGGGNEAFPLSSSFVGYNDTTEPQIFDPSTNIWTTPNVTGSFYPRTDLSSSIVKGKIYVLGGYTPHEELNTVEVFTPNTNDVRNAGELKSHFILLSNPISSSADFQFDALKEPTVFELFDALGRSVLHQQLSVGQASLHVNMQNMPAGMYLARLGKETVRFVKN